MSTDYYARLEQQRGPQPSTQMLGSLARALRLSADERDYLYRIAGHNAPTRLAATDYVAPALLRVLDRLTDAPALILSALGETLVQNDPARALFGDASRYRGLERSAIYRWFLHQEERERYPGRGPGPAEPSAGRVAPRGLRLAGGAVSGWRDRRGTHRAQ